MNNKNQKEINNSYLDLDINGKRIVEMYLTARQFKNAILEEEILILSTYKSKYKDGTIITWGDNKATFRGNKTLLRVYPFIVTKGIACEVYLKLILICNDFDLEIIRKEDLYELLKLYENANKYIKNDIFKYFVQNYKKRINKNFFETQLKNISSVLNKWRYIYEDYNKRNIININFLNIFCEYLDNYSQKIILENYNYDVSRIT